MGFFRVARGRNMLGVEANCAWATPGAWTETGNVPCNEDGSNCAPGSAFARRAGATGRFQDPWLARAAAGARVAAE